MSRLNRLRNELFYYRALATHPDVPRISKWLLAGAIAYLLSPVDLIPDFVPIIGHLDDLLIVPSMTWLALRIIPREIKMRVRNDLAKTQ